MCQRIGLAPKVLAGRRAGRAQSRIASITHPCTTTWPRPAHPTTRPAGDSEAGSVGSSGGAGPRLEFLPINQALNRTSECAGGTHPALQSLPAWLGRFSEHPGAHMQLEPQQRAWSPPWFCSSMPCAALPLRSRRHARPASSPCCLPLHVTCRGSARGRQPVALQGGPLLALGVSLLLHTGFHTADSLFPSSLAPAACSVLCVRGTFRGLLPWEAARVGGPGACGLQQRRRFGRALG